MIIFESLLTMFEASIIFEAVGSIKNWPMPKIKPSLAIF